MRIVYMGTPDIAVPTLRYLAESLYKKPKASMSFSGGSMFFFILSGHGVPFSVIAGDERSTERALQSEFFML